MTIADHHRAKREGRGRLRMLSFCMVTLFFGLSLVAESQVEGSEFTVERADPPQFGFYAKSVDCGGVVIRGSSSVKDSTLLSTCAKITTMLSLMDVSRQNLRQRGVELHIAGREQSILDLPESRDQRKLTERVDTKEPLPDEPRAKAGIYSACSEEDQPATDFERMPSGLDMCVRVFAIALMNYGFDAEIRREIATQFRSSIGKGLWQRTLATASVEDYWAELSLRYFNSRGGLLRTDQRSPAGSSDLRQYDPGGFNLLDLIYSGHKRPVAVEAIRARSVSKLALSRVSSRPAELQLVNNSAQRIRIFWIDTEGESRALGELGPYSRVIEPTYFFHVWMLEDQRGVELQRFVVEDYLSEVVAAD
jgi:hypothetical protein